MLRASRLFPIIVAAILTVHAQRAAADPTAVEHVPAANVFAEPATVTQRDPDVPREDDAVDVWLRVAFQFTYTDVAIYYTTDGSNPSGAFGTPSGTTQVLRNPATISFVRNETVGPNTYDWWKATFDAGTRAFNQQIRYKISAWQSGGGVEIFANGGAAYEYTNKLAWPGAGFGAPMPGQGYPPVHFWKEEATFGNTYCAGMLDQNGTLYDFHFPTPGGIYGVGTRNEGYVDGLDTFPPGLPSGWRGQMHVNQGMPGIRVGGVTYWLSNMSGTGYTDVTQSYHPTSNSIITSQRLIAAANDISVQQIDFAPAGIAFPTDAGSPVRHLHVKRMVLTNNTGSSVDANVYFYLDPALNGGDGYDAMFFDSSRGVMCAFDKATRTVTGTGAFFSDPNEYNPTTDAGYLKNVALYLGVGMKVLSGVGASGGAATTQSWRDTSGDQGQGWLGARVTLPPGTPVEVDFVLVGGHFRPNPVTDPMPVFDGVYDGQIVSGMNWFYSESMLSMQQVTDAHWTNWLNDGVTVDTPDDDYDALLSRGLLATALHVDGVNGCVIAGFHNGAYPYSWPRDAVYAAVTMARTGHLAEAAGVYTWMRDTCFRQFEAWGRKGFWKQKYSTDGYVIWGAPQIDETAVFPWGVLYQYQMTADAAFLGSHFDPVKDAVYAMTNDSLDTRLRYEEAFNLVYSNNVWEDSYDTFVYSNANCWRGLEDARAIFDALSNPGEAGNAAFWRDQIKGGLDARLDWDGENTDISQLGIVYPFNVYSPTDFRAARLADRINGVKKKFNDTHCCVEPLINFGGEHQDTVNRYWGDGYWNGGPWFLTTLWYGLYYAERQDVTAGKGDIDNHKYRIDLMIDRLGPAGLGAEQIAYGAGGGASLLYPGQFDFKLQTAWPNAWESMSTFADAVMKFLDYRPDAPANTVRFRPKLPSDWSTMTFRNVTLVNTPAGHTHKIDVTVSEDAWQRIASHAFVNRNGHPLNFETVVRVPAGSALIGVTDDCAPVGFAYDSALGKVTVGGALNTGMDAETTIRVYYGLRGDFDGSLAVDAADVSTFVNLLLGLDADCVKFPIADMNADSSVDAADIQPFVDAIVP